MLQKLPIKKSYLLPAGTILLVLLSYQLAFKKTIAAWQQNTSLNRQLAQSVEVSAAPAYLERKNTNLKKVIGLYQADTTEFRGSILSTIADIAGREQVSLSEVPTGDPGYHTPEFILQKLQFDGNYFLLEKVLNRLKSSPGIGVVRSVRFKIAKNEKNKKLLLEIYLVIIHK